jgi:hypothetical protein
LNWPDNKDFAFTIIDDTDDATLTNIKPVYDFLSKINMKTTKTVWVYPPRDEHIGQSLQDNTYAEYIIGLDKEGFEIQLHDVGSGAFTTNEINAGFDVFKNIFGRFPSLHTNHSRNPGNIYWGYKRYGPILNRILKLFSKKQTLFQGEEEKSLHFWGALSKEHIRYARNRDFQGINTLMFDPKMPYREKSKDKFSNYWFSCSAGNNLASFNSLISKANIDRLIQEKGCCIVYTHFGEDFANDTDNLSKSFVDKMSYLKEQNGWFVPATEILDHLKSQQKNDWAYGFYLNFVDLIWLFNRLLYKFKSIITLNKI